MRAKEGAVVLEDRFARTLDDLVGLFQSGRNASTERKAQLFDDMGTILSRAFSEQENAYLSQLDQGVLSIFASLSEETAQVA